MNLKKQYPTYCCPYCGKEVGYIGRLFAWFFGTRIHHCSFENVVTETDLDEIEPKELRQLFIK